MSGARLGQLSLRLDAVYCLGLGLLLVVVSPVAEAATGVPLALVLTLGLMTAAWGGFLWWSRIRRPLRQTLRLVMIANLLASAALVIASVAAGTVLLMLSAVAVSVDVAAFAVSQAAALRRLGEPGPSQ